jgi:hypothetical protein
MIKLSTWPSLRDQNAEQSQNIKTDNKSFERLEQFRYMGTTLTNKIILRKKIRAVTVRECLI